MTVEDDANLDLSEFNVARHAGVILDGAGGVLLLKRHRETLQGRPKKCRGGKSTTMMYSYEFTLCRRAVIVTLDLSANNLHLLKEDHWLSNPKNVLVLRLDEPAWTTGEATGPAETNDMATWAVADLARWLEAHDMAGPATHFRSQGVNGGDFLAFTTADELAHDLRTTPFVAKKVLRLRDAHLAAQPQT